MAVKRHTSALAYYKSFKSQLEKIPFDVKKAHELMARATLKDVEQSVSGSVKTSTLRKMGHPYGRGFTGPKGKGRGRLPGLPIHVQTGRLRGSVFMEKRSGSGRQSFAVGFRLPSTDPRRYVVSRTGTRKMVARGFWPHIEKRWKARNKALVDVFRRSVRS